MSPKGYPAPVEQRFWDKVDKAGDCWLWTATTYKNGYGQIRVNGLPARAHRVSYEMAFGPIPDGCVIDHLCHNGDKTCSGGWECAHRRCVRPDHLEAVPFEENVRRGKGGIHNQLKTHCPHGHLYAESNTWLDHGRRRCKTCMAAHVRTARRRKNPDAKVRRSKYQP